MAKNGWGAAKEGKVHSEENDHYGDYKMTDVKSSRDLNGLYGKYQGKMLGQKESSGSGD